MKKILGLDLGTNSIGWAVVNVNAEGNPESIEGMGSRIIPMGSDKSDFEKGTTITKNADRRTKRSSRRMNKRYKLRRNKLLFVLDKLGMLPEQIRFKNAMPEPTKIQDLELLTIKKGAMQLDSLQHYELREKALSEKIDLKDLGKILYQYNRLRGYNGGNNDDQNKNKKEIDDNTPKQYEVRIQSFYIKNVEQSDSTYTIKSGKDKGNTLYWFNIVVDDNDSEIKGVTKLQNLAEKIGEEIELEIRIKRTKKGENIEFAFPQKTNWRKQMEETEKILTEKQWFPCQLFVNDLHNYKWTKIRNRVILRQQYKNEFDAVWAKQEEHYPFLHDCPQEILCEIVNYIFPGPSSTQQALREEGLRNGLKYIIKEQIIYYQRPLKPQTDLISECQFEKGEKVIPISHPLFQEFRCWDQINRLYITSKQSIWNERKHKNVWQYTNRYLTNEQKIEIYNKLQKQKQIGFGEVAKIVQLQKDNSEFLNGLHIKAKLKGCDTKITITKLCGDLELKTEDIEPIWQAIYNNVHEGSEYDENSKRVQSIFNSLPANIEAQKRIEFALKLAQNIVFVRKYASLSKKAIENILPLMQIHPQHVPERIITNFNNIKHLLETGEITNDVLPQNYIIDFVQQHANIIEQGGIMYAFAAALVYGRHTKETIKPQITNYHDIKYVERNLRNPIVEQIVNETMQVIKALWKQFKLNTNELEIHVELARDLKNSAQEREKIYKGQLNNQKTNASIKQRLVELNQEVNDRNILLYSIWSQQRTEERPKFKNTKTPTQEEIEKLRIWEEQKCISPYTLKPIPLSGLFSRDYDIDHIIPKSRYFDDSRSNKVVCESKINEEKDNRTAWEYISQQNSTLGICTIDDYINHINKNYYGQKKKNLLAEKIPSNPVNRQLKDTQYISIAVKNELAKIVGSNNVKTTTGGVTDYLRNQWGLKNLFMKLTEPRFKQMELWDVDENGNPKEPWITNYFDKEKQKKVYEIKGWSKRYDHRHHAIDALVVALSNEKFIHRLNDLNKYFQDELAKRKDMIPIEGEDSLEEAFFKLSKEHRDKIMKEIESSRKFETPMKNIISEVEKHLESMIVSQKPKDKLAIKNTNGQKQLKIKAALHQETYYGKTLQRDTKTINISKLKAKDIPQIIDPILRDEIDKHHKKYETMREAFTGENLIAFNESRLQTKNKSALKPPVYKVKLWYDKSQTQENKLQQLYDNNPKKSIITGDNYLFIVMEQNGKRVFDIISLYDSVALAKDEIKEKVFDIETIKKYICESVRLTEKRDKQKQELLPKPDKVLFYLQQNDLVYMPDNDEDDILEFNAKELKLWLSDSGNKKEFAKRIYKVVKFTGKDCFFIPHNYAKEINIPKDLSEDELNAIKEKYKNKAIPKQELNYIEFGSYSNCTPLEKNNLLTISLREGKKYKGEKPRKIQDYCVKIKTDWLGNLIEFNGTKL